MIDLSISVVSWNTRDLLWRCLTSIYSTITNLDYEVIVVDNASLDGSAAMVSEAFPKVKLIQNAENLGFAAANNQALAASSGRYLLLLNSDAVLLPGTVRAMVSYLEVHATTAIVGAQLLNADGSFQWSYADFPSLAGETLLLGGLARLVHDRFFPSYPPHRSNTSREVDWVSGACLLARRSAIDAVGGLDEDYFMYTEETDWCYRMRRAGWRIAYLPGARVLHSAGQSAKTAPLRKRSQIYRSKRLFFQKHRGRLQATAFSSILLVASAAKLIMTWALATLAPTPTRRSWARQQVRSYAALLKDL